jgi:hypothetical protein
MNPSALRETDFMQKMKFFIILALVGVFLAVAAGLLMTVGKTFGQFFFGKSFAEDQLRTYVSRVLKQDINGINCQPMDTDANGYVSCDYTTVGDPNRVQTIECAAWGLDGFFNRGCKVRMPSFPTQTR